jgi:hypothetical protein
MIFIHPSRTADYVIDTLMLVWFFSRIRSGEQKGRGQLVWKVAAVVAMVVLYPPWPAVVSPVENLAAMIIRFVVRVLLSTVYLKGGKGVALDRAGYFACWYTILYHSSLNINVVPLTVLVQEQLGELLGVSESAVGYGLLGELCSHGIALLLLWGIQRLVRFNDISQIGAVRISFVMAASACVIYAKTTISLVGTALGDYGVLVSIIMVLMHLCLIAMMILFERFMKLRRDQEDERLQEVSNAYILRSMQTWKEGQESTRALAHDMKNHLLAIRRLSAAGDEKKVGEYVDQLLSELNVEARSVETGNDLLNGIIAEKAAEAARDGIELSVVLDSSLLAFVSDKDLCTIFGNTLDNAIEASRQVSDPAARYIALRGLRAAGQAIVTITNSCATMPKIDDVLPETTKEGGIHGFGLKNVYRTVKKYGGFLALDTKTEGRFCLSVLLPIPGGSN